MLVMGILLAGLYVYAIIWRGGILRNIAGIIFDVILLLLLIQISVFFHAQFTLPVRSLRNRLRISSRLWLYWRKAHGPAVFVKDGREIARAGEGERRGPGLIWVDSASAVVMWSSMGHKEVLGPGIHFTEEGQRIGRTFSLHTQTCSLGPSLEDPIFEKPAEQTSEEQRKKHGAMQASRTAVSGRTRDGNEVVPNITVSFRLDSQPVRGEGPGSRFGFSEEAVERASRAEGINADGDPALQSRVAWNQLPGLIAIDLWREYLSKFTLDELFSPTFPALPTLPQPAEPPPPIEIPSTPLIVKRNLFVRLLRQRNNAFEKWLDRKGIGQQAKPIREPPERFGNTWTSDDGRDCTALQTIGQMIQRRMTQAAVPVLDECGRILEGHTISPEFRRLNERGLAVQKVTISGLRFDPSIEGQIVQLWNTGWLANAQAERQQVEQLERLAAQNGRQQALLEHALALSRAIERDKSSDMVTAVKTLLQATESEIVTDKRLFARAGAEAEAVSSLIRWVESGQHE
jgi:hypothetical protein